VQGAEYTLQGTVMQGVIVQYAMSIYRCTCLNYGWQVGNGRKPQGALSKSLYTAIIPYSVCRVESAASFHVFVHDEGSSILPLKALKNSITSLAKVLRKEPGQFVGNFLEVKPVKYC
jgi:hypothetical protein